MSISKSFIESIANTVGTDFRNYKIVRRGQFAYGAVTSRNGDKISVALLDEDECIISSAYTVFEIIDDYKLIPEYLMLWFRRPEFDRYARFKSHGSVREADYDEFDTVEYDYDKSDIKIDGIRKMVQGQGYCAYLNAVMAIALQKMLIGYNLYAPRFLVLDSPILSLSEKMKPGEKTASTRMKKGLFRYLDQECTDFQSIIIENEIPDIKYENAKLLKFTQDDNVGRYGLIESYRMS